MPGGYQAILDALGDPTLAVTESGEIVHLNAAARALLGWTAAALVGAPLERVLPGQAARPTSGPPASATARHHDGRALDVELRIAALPEGLLVVELRSRSERVELEQKLRRAAVERSRLELLNEAGLRLDASLDYERTLADLSRLVVRSFAEACVVDLVVPGQTMRRVAVSADTPAWQSLFEELRDRYPPTYDSRAPAARVVRTGAPLRLDEADLAAACRDDAHRALIEQLGVRLCIAAPMMARGGAVGALTFAWREVPLGANEAPALAVELGNRAALAIENARLYRAEKEARLSSELSEARLRSLFMQAPVAISIQRGPEHIYELANPLVEQLAGRGDLVGQRVADVFPGMTAEQRADLDHVYRTGEAVSRREVPVQLAPGHVRLFNAELQAVRNLDGAVEGVLSLAVDVTAEVDARHAVEAERAQLRQLFAGAPVAIAIQRGPTHVYELANEAYRALLGGIELVGRARRDVLPDVATMSHILDEVYATGRLFEGQERRLLVQRTPGGELVPAYLNFVCQPMRDARGQVEGIITFAVEVTEQVEGRQRQERLAAELRQSVLARDEFLSIAAHELRTPLTPLTLQVGGIRQHLGRGQQQIAVDWMSPRVDSIERQVRRMGGLVERLLDISRITSGRIDLDLEELALDALVGDIVLRFGDTTPGLVGLEVDGGPLVGRWDRLRIDQVVTNLISNAIKYGAGRPVEVRVGRRGLMAVVAVRDHGIGIAEADQQRIFQRFERAVSQQHYGGFGLGLWIVRQLVEALGGSVELESRPDEGSTFTVLLPLASA